MSLSPPESVRKLQGTLHAQAKEAPAYRFYALYDKVYRADVLAYAYRCCRANGGAAGVDGETFAAIESAGWERWLEVLAGALREKTYRPAAIRRGYTLKPDGSRRPLGILTVADRVVQTAVRIVVEPIFETDLPAEQYAYRPQRSAQQAVQAVRALARAGHTEVVDADLRNYFGTLPHAELLKSVARRISDGAVLSLLKRWLVAPVEETDARGRVTRTTAAKDEGRGTPQGAPLSPLLANLYMRRFILAWRQHGLQARLDAHIVSYADDLVICCRGTGRPAYAAMQALMTRLKLTVNEAKSRRRRLPEESVDFLGYTIGRCYVPTTGRAYLGTYPSKKAVRHVCAAIGAATQRRWLWRDSREVVAELNRVMIGWANYFCLGPVSKAYRAVDAHARERLRRWLRNKYKLANQGITRFPDPRLHQQLGLVSLAPRTRNLPWANA